MVAFKLENEFSFFVLFSFENLPDRDRNVSDISGLQV
jgi:hypothetical protein